MILIGADGKLQKLEQAGGALVQGAVKAVRVKNMYPTDPSAVTSFRVRLEGDLNPNTLGRPRRAGSGATFADPRARRDRSPATIPDRLIGSGDGDVVEVDAQHLVDFSPDYRPYSTPAQQKTEQKTNQ